MHTIFHTAMYEAFIAARVTKHTGAAIVNTCAKALQSPQAGLINLGKGWNAHLSFKTAKKLEMPECNNPHARMAYDDMLRS